MGDWQNFDNSPKKEAVVALLTSLEQNDAQYLKGEIDREKYIEVARGIDDKLAVAGLRLATRPWQQGSR